MTSPAPRRMVDRAIHFGGIGLAVFPIYTIDDGACSCGNARCTSPGKHPIGSLVPQGVLEASTDPGLLREWWALYPDANIGIATGDISGIVVLDIDLKRSGDVTLEALENKYDFLPETWCAVTGSGGFHFYFAMPGADIRNSAGAIGAGIDVRGNGGYVVAPPSKHVSGSAYQWSPNLHPRNIPKIADVPGWLLEKMAPRQRAFQESKPLPSKIREGERNMWMTSAAGTMRRRGFSADAIFAAIVVENRRRCDPPMLEAELRKVASSVERYAPESQIRTRVA